MLGSLRESNSPHNDRILEVQALAEYTNLHSDYSVISDLIYLLPPVYKGTLNTNEKQKIQAIYNYVYPDVVISYFSPFCQSSKKCSVVGEVFTSTSVITAFWPVESCNLMVDSNLQVGRII